MPFQRRNINESSDLPYNLPDTLNTYDKIESIISGNFGYDVRRIIIVDNNSDSHGLSRNGSLAAPFLTLKEALIYARDYMTPTDNTRIGILIYNGYYVEDNPLPIVPYVHIMGFKKLGSKIVPANHLSNLFEFPAGTYSCSINELVIYAPLYAYALYSGVGSIPIFGYFNNILVGLGTTSKGIYWYETGAGLEEVDCKSYYIVGSYIDIVNGKYKSTNHLIWENTQVTEFCNITGSGEATFYMAQNESLYVSRLFYSNSSTSNIKVYCFSSKSGNVLETGPLGGNIYVQGTTFNNDSFIDAGHIELHDCVFMNNSKIDTTTGNCQFMRLVQVFNKNELTYCVKFTGNNSDFYAVSGNYFKSPSGIEPIQLDGTFHEIFIEGLKQYEIVSINPNDFHVINHYPDNDLSRIVQIIAFQSDTSSDSIEYNVSVEDNFVQEDDTKTIFTDNHVQLEGIGATAYLQLKLNEEVGVYALDSSGNNRTGSLVNMSFYTNGIVGKIGRALNFIPDYEAYIDCGGVATFTYSDPFSLCAWIRTTSSTSMEIICKYRYNTSNKRGYDLYMEAGKIGFILSDRYGSGPRAKEIQTTNTFNDGNWHRVIATYQGSSSGIAGMKIYVDNTLQTTNTIYNGSTSNIVDAAANLVIGSTSDNHTIYQFDGDIDDVIVFDKELNTGEIAFDWNSGNGTEELPGSFDTTKDYYVMTTSFSELSTAGLTTISQIIIEDSTPINTSIHYLISIDSGITWNYWNGTSWQTSTLENGYTNGNTSTTLNSLTDIQIDDLFIPGTFGVAAFLKTTSQYVTPILYKFSIISSDEEIKLMLGDDQIEVIYLGSNQTKIKNKTTETLYGLTANIFQLQAY